jgi:hypothetical protein
MLPDNKHLSNFTKFFTDFQKVTLDSEKDYPLFLLNQMYTAPVLQSSEGTSLSTYFVGKN